MDENPLPGVTYTKRANSDAKTIKSYLLYKFTQREVDNFYKLLASFEKVVVIFPDLHPIVVTRRKIRRAVLSKQLSVFYRIRTNCISVIAILDNRMNPAKWP